MVRSSHVTEVIIICQPKKPFIFCFLKHIDKTQQPVDHLQFIVKVKRQPFVIYYAFCYFSDNTLKVTCDRESSGLWGVVEPVGNGNTIRSNTMLTQKDF